jgi:hypothetical protein
MGHARITGAIAANVSLADRQRLGHARMVFLHLLSQDPRLKSAFDGVSRKVGLARALKDLERAREAWATGTVAEGDYERHVERLRRFVRPRLRAISAAMKPIARDTLGCRWGWIQNDLAILYLQRLGLPWLVVDPFERSPFDGPAPRRVKIDFKPPPWWTAREVRAEALRRLNAMVPDGDGADTSRAPRRNAGHLADYVYWFYLRRCVSPAVSERRTAKLAKTSRTRIAKGVKEVERLFSLISPLQL